MTIDDAKELAELRQIAEMKANLARARVLAVRRSIAALHAEATALDSEQLDAGGFNPVAAERWSAWKQNHRRKLNEKLALERATLAKVTWAAGRVIAREDALRMLHKETMHEAQRRTAARRAETALLEFLTNNVRDENIGHDTP